MAELSKIGPAHLRREAWVYVRQSTMTQVRENTESLNRQYELAQRARHLGWPADVQRGPFAFLVGRLWPAVRCAQGRGLR